MNERPQERVPYFDGFLAARTSEARRLVESVASHVIQMLKPTRPSSIHRVKRQVEAIICNAALNEQTAIPLSKQVLGRRDRYRPLVLRESIRKVLDTLVDLGYIKLDIGTKSSFEPVELDEDDEGEAFIAENAGHTGLSRISSLRIPSIPRQHFGRHPHEGERIILKKQKVKRHRGFNLAYVDTPDTERMRSELETISDAIRIGVEYLGNGSRIDDNDVFLQRHFIRIAGKEDFTQGGRISGSPYPWWLALSSKDRFNDIAIDGADRLVEVDYGQHAIRCLYGLAGARAHFEDAYAVPGYEHHRDGAKKVLNSMIWAEAPLSRFPKTEAGEPPLSLMFPSGTNVTDVTEAILRFHEPVANLFYQGHGYGLQYMESQTLVKVLLRLLDAGVTALPYHDAILVAEEHQTLAVEVMLSAFREVVGMDGKVKVRTSDT
ncbi:hypothetical protein [Caballeronia novacaledonica]|uniref:Uncharacterized protein n=1 Tax=Caballeronia novacaledonica TaxID=1544861 RepID=A0AA37IJ55_9BURK|nr:hypothetical protein [Caballeronia novacaledonica]GJH30229.1 hypothetical protein CBA19CS42_36955 [Caballeronia novacaledonica]